MAGDNNNPLNLFRFGSRKKSTNDIKTDDISPPIAKVQTDTTDLDPITSRENDADIETYPPDSFYSTSNQYSQTHLQSPTSPSESSLIFERSVEDPSQVYQQTTCPRCGHNRSSNASNSGLNCNHQSIVDLPTHYSVENFVSPCLDATTKILTDKDTNLDNVDMVYSRRPSSVMGLNLALGRTKSFANEDTNELSNLSSISRRNSSAKLTKTNSLANMTDSTNPKRPPTLSFYSYADMINNENPNPKRPSISQSLSSSFVNQARSPNSRSNSISQSNFLQSAGNSITPQRNPRNSFSRSNISNNVSQSNISNLNSKKKFQLTPDSPNSSDSESDYPNSIIKSSSSRRKNSINSKSSKKLSKTISNSSSLNSPAQNLNRRFSNLDDNLYYTNSGSDNESLVISSIGDHLRRNNGEIQSSNNSIIA